MSKVGEAIISRGTTKIYSNGITALRGLDLEVSRGIVFSLLGRNGAGKTTFVRIASTQLMPNSGFVNVLGLDVVTEAHKIRGKVAVVPQEGRPSSLCTPFEHIFHYLVARGTSISEARQRARKTLEVLELEDHAETICSQLSGGLRQRTLVAMALATDTELLFLDEPTIGLDAVTRLTIWDSIRTMTKKEGRTVLLTTHYMEEAEALSDMVAIIDRGKVVSAGTVEELKGKLNASMKVEIANGPLTLEELEVFGKVVKLGETYRLFVEGGVTREVVDMAIKRGVRPRVSEVTLEDVFVVTVGERLEDGGN